MLTMLTIRQFKNGNFNIKADAVGQNLLEDLHNCADTDFMLFGEVSTVGNSEVSYKFYNNYTDKLYLVLGSEVEDYKQGRSVKLRPCLMTKEDYTELDGE